MIPTMTGSTHEFFDILAKVLLRCCIFGFLLLLLWLGMFLLACNVIFGLHGNMFGLSLHELNVIHFCGMAFLKLLVIVVFFMPWLAIRMVLRRSSGDQR
jgi:hypothetical protein